jgi:hypothetical protein
MILSQKLVEKCERVRLSRGIHRLAANWQSRTHVHATQVRIISVLASPLSVDEGTAGDPALAKQRFGVNFRANRVTLHTNRRARE